MRTPSRIFSVLTLFVAHKQTSETGATTMSEEPTFDEVRRLFDGIAGARIRIIGGQWRGMKGRLLRITKCFVVWEDDDGRERRTLRDHFTWCHEVDEPEDDPEDEPEDEPEVEPSVQAHMIEDDD
jgi:hypothetical protein